MIDPVEQALAHLRQSEAPDGQEVAHPITLNFHPDIEVGGGLLIALLAQNGTYRSQFETGTSNGSLSAYPGGERWNWESRMFGGAYDGGPPAARPKYGALNYRRDPVGGSRRFGSCHLRLASHIRSRASFCYPDSHLEPQDFAVDGVGPLVVLAEENRRALDPWLDNYIEAHVHGRVSMADDVEAVVLDPSFHGTAVEDAAHALGCGVEWHDGFRLSLDHLADCRLYRGPVAAEAVAAIAVGRTVTPAILSRARVDLLDYQTAKWVWHCIARFGHC